MQNYASAGGKSVGKKDLKSDLKTAIQQYHDAMNNGDWEKCLQMTCPDKLSESDIEQFKFNFLNYMGPYGGLQLSSDIIINLMIGKNHSKYKNRDYAQVFYNRMSPKKPKPMKVHEVWVKHGSEWKCTTILK